MANRIDALDVENQAEESVAEHRKPAITMVLRAVIKGMRVKRKLLLMWSRIFVISCVFAVSLDPLFFYILVIDQDNKCLQMDKKLSTTVIVLRSLVDIIFAVPFIYEIHERVKFLNHNNMSRNTMRILDRKSKGRVLIEVGKKIALKMSWLSFSIINNFLALLPVPQLLIVVTFYNMRGAEYVEHKNFLNVFLIGQYLPRIYRIHQSSKKLQRTAGILVKILFNFVLYIVASHILGAFWHFFSIQQKTTCWQHACAKYSPNPIGCMNTFYCGQQTNTSRNITFLNEHCPLDASDGALPPFNFGIFLDSLKNHDSEDLKFGKKFFYSLWWGLRNLRNFGTNLTTSTYVWENLFAILISVVGLLLFLYLIGNVQTFMQMRTTKREKKRLKEVEDKVTRWKNRLKMLDVAKWIYENNFPDGIKNEITNSIEETLNKDKDTDVHKPFLILPWPTQKSIKRFLFRKTLGTVDKLKDMNERVLTLMCDCLKPVTYNENSFIFRVGDPLDCIVFIVDGTTWTYGSSNSHVWQGISSMAVKHLEKGNFYGEELLDRPSSYFTELPVSSKHVKSLTIVEAFVLMAKDMEAVVNRFPLQWAKKGSPEAEHIAASIIAKAWRRTVQRRWY